MNQGVIAMLVYNSGWRLLYKHVDLELIRGRDSEGVWNYNGVDGGPGWLGSMGGMVMLGMGAMNPDVDAKFVDIADCVVVE